MGTLAGFIKKYDGKKIGSGQCVAEMRAWLKWRYGSAIEGIPTVVDAEDVWKAASSKVWEKHGRASGYIPKRDALVVLRGHAGQEHGHVCHTRDASTKDYLYTFDQNWSHKLHCARERHKVDSRIIGYLVHK